MTLKFNILKYFINSKTKKKIIKNSGWLFLEKSLRVLLELFILGWVGRYLGPSLFGQLNYAIAFYTIFFALSTLGMDSIIIRDFLRYPEKRSEIIGTSFFLKFGSSILVILLAGISVIIIRPGDHLMLKLILIIAVSGIFRSLEVIDFYFQSQIKSKLTVIAKGSALFCAAGLRVFLILSKSSIIAFAAVVPFEFLMAGLIFSYLYHHTSGKISGWMFRIKRAFTLLKESWPLMISIFATFLYSRIDQIMIGSMVNDYWVGIYAASTMITELALKIVIILGVSLFPVLVDKYEKDKGRFFKVYARITEIYTLFSFVLLLGIILFGKYIVLILFGNGYSQVNTILPIQFIGTVFVFNAALRSSYLTISSKLIIVSLTSIFAALCNVLMNFLLIPRYGAQGAAIATVITQALSLLVLNICFASTRKIFRIQFEALFMVSFFGRLFNRK